ncbi:MAG: AAC(3) family N-acetyltransferase [Candidatus Hydrogenedentes bacterium]|nr:AAC(3) family N-acetyltransferase [Candidatus Hydrogenedentota bacterium]
MSEESVILVTGLEPATVDSLAENFAQLGVEPGMTLLVHASLSALGWVCGGPTAVILALERVLGEDGTLVMPAHSGDLSEPSLWQEPPVPEAWWPVIRDSMPAYQPEFTPTRGMGVIAETFRKQPGVRRSVHPQVSFTARGRHAQAVTEGHCLDFGLGEGSPLARLYEHDAWVLLLGVGHDSNTSIHLAEYRAVYPGKRAIQNGAPILRNGVREWTRFEDLALDTQDFVALGSAFEHETGRTCSGRVAQCTTGLMPQRALVDFATAWLEKTRG